MTLSRWIQSELSWEEYHTGEVAEVEGDEVEELDEEELNKAGEIERYGSVTTAFVHTRGGKTADVPVSATRKKIAPIQIQRR